MSGSEFGFQHPLKKVRGWIDDLWVKVIAAKLNDLSSIPGSHVVEGEQTPKGLLSYCLMWFGMQVSTHVHRILLKKCLK